MVFFCYEVILLLFFFKDNYAVLNSVCLCVSVDGYVHMSVGIHGGQKRASMGLEFQVL